METKDVLKTKLAEVLKSRKVSHAPEIRAELQSILSYGSRDDAAHIKAASAKQQAVKEGVKTVTETVKEMGKFRKFIKSTGEVSKEIEPTVKILGSLAVAAPLAAKAYKAVKMRKMSPMKRALTKGFGKDTIGRKALAFGAGAAGITAGIKGVEGLSDAAITPIKKQKAFNSMMDDNPGLKRENKKDVKRVFNTLFRFNPKMAGDPLVAGSFMKRTLQFKDEGIQPVDVKTLTEVARNMSSNKANNSILSSAFLGGAKELASFAG